MQALVLRLALAWLFLGIVGLILYSLGVGINNYSWLLIFPIGIIFLTTQKTFTFVIHSKRDLQQKSIIIALVGIWLLHLLQVFVPETGFDALWYHLPIIQDMVDTGNFVFQPDLYQSANPLLGEILLSYGYSFLGVLGAKLVAWLFGVSLVLASFSLARYVVSRNWSLWVAIGVSVFQVVAWQSSSVYVDVMKAFWEIIFLLYLFRLSSKVHHQLRSKNVHRFENQNRSLLILSLFFGASLATKMFSLGLLGLFMISIYSLFKSSKQVMSAIFLSLLLPAYFYYRSHVHLGSAIYSLSHHLGKLSEIGGNSSVLYYLLQRTYSLPWSVIQLLLVKDYVLVALVVLLPVVIWKAVTFSLTKFQTILLIWSVGQWLVWWYLPPLSTRYALSGFVSLFVLEISIVATLNEANKHWQKAIEMLLVLSLVWAILPRLVVAGRSFIYLSANQSQTEYLSKFMDGNVDRHINNWYFPTIEKNQ